MPTKRKAQPVKKAAPKTRTKTRAELLKGVSKGKDKDGIYIKTHRARSKSYPSIEKIPMSVLKFIESTG